MKKLKFQKLYFVFLHIYLKHDATCEISGQVHLPNRLNTDAILNAGRMY